MYVIWVTSAQEQREFYSPREVGKWQISGVKNIKELVEFANEMSLP